MSLWVQVIALVITVISTIVGVALVLSRRFDRLERNQERLELRVATIEHQNRALLKAFTQVTSTLIGAQIPPSDRGIQLIADALDAAPIAEILRTIKPTSNPLSQEELNRLNTYIERLKHGAWLSTEEAHEFYRLSDVITREYPAKEGSWQLFLIGGILLGMMISKK